MKNESTLFVLALALALRLMGITQSFWLDEAAQAIESARPLSQQLYLGADFQPPLYHLLVHFWMYFGQSEWWLRLTSVIPGLITVWATMAIARKLKNNHAAIMAGLLLATSQFHIFYSQELRPYSLNAMFGVLSILFLLYIYKDQKSYRIPYLLSLIGGLYSGYLFPFFMLFQLVATAIWHRAHLRQIFLYQLAAGLSFLPWLPSFLGQFQTGLSWAGDSETWKNVVSPPLIKMLPLTALKFISGRIPFASIKVAGILALALFGYNAIAGATKKHGQFIALWLALPVLLALLVSIFVPVLDPKRVLFSLPALYLLVAINLNRSLKSLALVIVMLNLNLLSLRMYLTDENNQREPWKKAIQIIETNRKPGSAAVFAFPEPFAPWLWYADPAIPTIAAGPNRVSRDQFNLEIKKLQVPETLYVFEYLMDMSDPERQLMGWIKEAGYSEAGFYQYPGIGKIYIMVKSPQFAYGK